MECQGINIVTFFFCRQVCKSWNKKTLPCVYDWKGHEGCPFFC